MIVDGGKSKQAGVLRLERPIYGLDDYLTWLAMHGFENIERTWLVVSLNLMMG